MFQSGSALTAAVPALCVGPLTDGKWTFGQVRLHCKRKSAAWWIAVIGMLAIDVEVSAQSGEDFSFLTNSLVAHYAFSGNANDESGLGNHGEAHQTMLTPDRFEVLDSAYAFDGASSWLELPNTLGVPGASQLTVSMWVDGSGPGNLFYYWVFRAWSGVPSPLPNVAVRLDQWSGHFMYIHTEQAWSHQPLLPNTWNHLAFVFDGTAETAKDRVRYYLNGDPVDLVMPNGGQGYPTQLAIPTMGTKTVIGAEVSYYGDFLESYFQGGIDDVRIYLNALTASEVSALFEIESRSLPQLWIQDPLEPMLTVVGEVGGQYQLQRSGDLAQWSDEGDTFLAASEIFVIRPAIDGASRYWRVKALP
jgi:hypothetical protein